MKGYLVYVTFDDGSSEGVMFTDKSDAIDAINGVDEGASLAVEWSELMQDATAAQQIIEVDLPEVE